jgi:hypothetical protein
VQFMRMLKEHLPVRAEQKLNGVAGVNTSVMGLFGMQGWPDHMNIHTISGNIELELSVNSSVEFDVWAPRLHLRSEFPVAMQHAHRTGSVMGRIGKAESKLRISTVSGYVNLKKAA